jgi:hypothetical protein
MEQRKIEHTIVDIDSVQTHPKNVRQGDIGAISESLKAHGQYRPIVVDRRTNRILAGNHTWKAAKALGWAEISAGFIETKDDDEALRILLADNRTTDLASYDDAELVNLLKDLAETDDGLIGTAFDGDALDQLLMDLEQEPFGLDLEPKYIQDLKVPQYEIVGDEPNITDLTNTTKTDELTKQIQESNLSSDLKVFLQAAATRHIIFDYGKIAEFYPHQTPEVQRLMEQSVLIIIDANDAIANGYAKLATTLSELQLQDEQDVK